MKRIIASEHFNETDLLVPFGTRWNMNAHAKIPLVSDATREHEKAVAREYTWPALPVRLRSLPDVRAMVRHWVRTDYQWKP